MLAGKPLQRRSAARRGRTLAPAAVSRGQERPTSPLPRAVAAEEKVVASEIDASAPISSSSAAAAAPFSPERLVPEVADLEDILAERDACGVSLLLEVIYALELELAASRQLEGREDGKRIDRQGEGARSPRERAGAKGERAFSSRGSSKTGGGNMNSPLFSRLSHLFSLSFLFSLSHLSPPHNNNNKNTSRSASSPTSSFPPRTRSSPRP